MKTMLMAVTVLGVTIAGMILSARRRNKDLNARNMSLEARKEPDHSGIPDRNPAHAMG